MNRRSLIVSGATNAGGSVFTLAVWLFLTPFVVHSLGPRDYGLWVLIQSIVSYGALMDFGFTNGVTKYVAELVARDELDAAGRIVGTALTTLAAMGVVAFLICAVGVRVFSDAFAVGPSQRRTVELVVLLLGVNLAVRLPAFVLLGVLRGLHRYDMINAVSTAGTIFSALLTVAVLSGGWGIVALAAFAAPLQAVMQIPMLWFIHRAEPRLSLKPQMPGGGEARKLIGFGFAQFAINAGGMIALKSDQIVIGAFLSLTSVTLFTLVRKLTDVATALMSQLFAALLPAASHLQAQGQSARLGDLYVAATRISLGLYVLIAGGVMVFGNQMLKLWIGGGYGETHYLFPILVANGLFAVLMMSPRFAMLGIGRHRQQAVLSVCQVTLNIAVSILLVRSIGIAGVALGTFVAMAIEAPLVVASSLGKVGVSTRRFLTCAILPVALATIPMLALLYAVRTGVAPSAWVDVFLVWPLAALVYVCFHLAMPAARIERGYVSGARSRLGRRPVQSGRLTGA